MTKKHEQFPRGAELNAWWYETATWCHMIDKIEHVLYDFLVTVKAAPHECVIRTGLH